MAIFIKGTLDASDIESGNKKSADSFDRVRAAERRARQESAELYRLVKQGAKEGETATRRYERSIDLANRSLKAGKINQQEYTDAVTRARAELKRAGEASRDAFDPTVLTSAVGTFVSISTVISAISSHLAKVRAQSEEIAQLNQESADTLGRLAQVGGQNLTPELQLRARQAFGAGATESLALAGDLVFSAKSANLLDDLGTFVKVAANRFETQGIQQLPADVRALQTAFGDAQAGNTAEVLANAVAASTQASEGIAQLLQATGKVGASAAAVGVTDEETLASIALLSNPLGSAAEAGTAVRSLLKSFDKIGIQGDTLADKVQVVSKRIEGGETIQDVLGDRVEAQTAFRLLNQNLKELASLVRLQNQSDASTLESQLSAGLQDTTVSSAIISRRAQNQQLLAAEQQGNQELIEEAIRDSLEALRRDAGRSAGTIAFLRSLETRGPLNTLGGLVDLQIAPNPGVQNDLVAAAVANASGEEDIRRILETGEQLKEQTRLLQEIKAGGNRVTVPRPEAP